MILSERCPCPSIFLTNARSVLPKLDELRLTTSLVNADIVIVTESWLTSLIDDDLLHLNHCDIFRCDRELRKGGGVCIWMKRKFRPSLVTTTHSVPSAIEVVFIRATCMNISLVCCAIYVPPNLCNAEHLAIMEFLLLEFDHVLSLYPDVKFVLAGDFNDFRTDFLSEQLGLTSTVVDATRNNSILDQIWIDDDLRDLYISSATVGPPLQNSDHNCILLPPVNDYGSEHLRPTVVWDYRTSNISEYLRRLSCTDFTETLKPTSVDEMCERFYEALAWPLSAIPRHLVTFSPKDKPWMTPILKLLINSRWQAFRQRNWPAYLHFKAKVKVEITKAKRIWSNKQIKTTRGLWSVVKSIRGSGHKDPWLRLIDEFGSLENLLKCLSVEFSKNFNLSTDSVLLPLSDEKWSISVSDENVFYHLCRLSSRKAMGPDCIPPKLLNIGAQFLCVPVAKIFNLSLDTRTFPSVFKCAHVCPIPKSTTPSLSDFRPISLLSPLSKVFEKIVLAHVKPELFSCFGPNQHAYRPLASTTTALVDLCDIATNSLDLKDTCAVNIFCLDLSRAFDKLMHHRLINHLHDQGLNHGFLKWLLSYLSSRSMRVKIMNTLGPLVAIQSGVPQGSVLGPFLFTAFMGSIDFSKSNTKCVKYADDVTIIETVSRNQPSTITFDACEDAFNSVGLLLNKSKCKLLTIQRSRLYNQGSSTGFTEVEAVKILGVILTNNFKWESNINAKIKTASRRLHIIRCLKSMLSTHELIRVYHALITSVFLYASPASGRLPRALTNKIESVQRRAHRIICEPNCDCSLFPPLSSKFEEAAVDLLVRSCTFACHPLHFRVPTKLPRSGHFRIPTCNTDRRLNSFFPWASLLYNARS